jgi:methyl-accepting chemotaxis protein
MLDRLRLAIAAPRTAPRTIRARLLGGFALLTVLLTATSVVAWRALHESADAATTALDGVRRDARLASRMAATVAGELEAATRYLHGGDAAALGEFRTQMFASHRISRAMTRSVTRAPEQAALVGTIDRTLAQVEVTFNRAHRLAELGERDAAEREAAAAAADVRALLAALDRLGASAERDVAAVAGTMRDEAEARALLIAVATLAMLALGTLVIGVTLRGVTRPLQALVTHAESLQRGDFDARTDGALPGEFMTLAGAMNAAGASLGAYTTAAATTASDLAASAGELSHAGERIAEVATQVSQVMSGVTSGAQREVDVLRGIDMEMERLGAGATAVRSEAGLVAHLAGNIAREAGEQRQRLQRATEAMRQVRGAVGDATRTVESLHGETQEITGLASRVGRIAEQTNLLALNAAIEAARAGDAGRGFGVVADEVRKLAEQAQRAADDVARLVHTVTTKVDATVRAMQAGQGQVTEIEAAGTEVDTALQEIGLSATRTTSAARQLSELASANTGALSTVQQSLSAIAREAVAHAQAAQQASAAARSQVDACHDVSAATQLLLAQGTRLRQLVAARGATLEHAVVAPEPTADDALPASIVARLTPPTLRLVE